MNNNNNNNNNNNTTGYRPIVPAPSSSSTIISPMIPISPHQSPQARPSPQHGILPPPMSSMSFRTPPVSPFSLPINMNPEYLPPPLQPLPPMMSMTTPPSPTNGRYEQRILPKQQASSTSVFSVPMTPSNASSVMQHHNSVIHPHPPYQQQRVSLGGAATGANGDKQLTTADQRELARKVSHSAIERRRRERINDKILQLKELIPSCADQDHLHKLSILQSAIEYIQYLQGCVAESRKREGNNNSEERFTKRSKFDRYEIPIPKHMKNDDSDKTEYKRKNSSGKSSDSDGENSVTSTSATSTSAKKETTDASTNTDTNSKCGEEEANTLLLLSKSTSTDNNDKNNDTNNNNNNNKEIPKTRDVEVQTSLNTNEIIEIEEKEEEEQKEEPRGGISVQQLLCN